MNQLPNGWSLTSIADIAIFNPKTIADDSLNCAFAPMQYLGTRFRAQMNYEQKTWGEIKKSYVHFQTGDVIVAKVTPCFENGKAGIAPHLPNGIGAGSSEFCVFRPAQGINERYLLAWLSSEDFRKRAAVAMTGSVGLKRVPKEVFLTEEIPLPPEAEQRRIADKLDTTLARVDALNDRLARITPLLKRFRQSVLAAATSGRLTEDWQETSGSEKWKKTNLSEICFVTKLAGFEYTNFVKYSNDGDLNVVKAENVGKDGFKYTEFSKVKSEAVNHLTRSKIKEGDLLMVFVGAGTGKVGRVPVGENWFLGPNVAMIRLLSEENNSRFIEYFLRSQNGLNEIKKFVKSTAQPSLSMTSIRQFEVSLPNLEEQTEIVRRVEILFAFADRLEARLQSAQTAAERLTPALLAKAFRGELVPQDPSDEPATELLRRLREARVAQVPTKKPRKTTTACA